MLKIISLSLFICLFHFSSGINFNNYSGSSCNKPKFYFERKISIYLKEYDYTFTPQEPNCNDAIKIKLNDGKILKISLFDCMGKMDVKVIDNGKLAEEGTYINSLDTLKQYTTLVDMITGKAIIKVYQYYQPLRDGVWKKYKHGKLTDTSLYKVGIKVENSGTPK